MLGPSSFSPLSLWSAVVGSQESPSWILIVQSPTLNKLNPRTRQAHHSNAHDAVSWVYTVYFSFWSSDCLMITSWQQTESHLFATTLTPWNYRFNDGSTSAWELRTTHGHKKPWPEPWSCGGPGSWFGEFWRYLELEWGMIYLISHV